MNNIKKILCIFAFAVVLLSSLFPVSGIAQSWTPNAEGGWNCSNGKPVGTITWRGEPGAIEHGLFRDGQEVYRGRMPGYIDEDLDYNNWYEYRIQAYFPPDAPPWNQVDGGSIATGSCIHLSSITGPVTVLAGTSATYTGNFIIGYIPGNLWTQVELISPNGTAAWIGGGNNPVTGTANFPTPGPYNIRVDSEIFQNWFAEGSVTRAVETIAVNAIAGTLNTSNCVIASGASSCNSSVEWNTESWGGTDTSAVTTPTNITVATGNYGYTTYPLTSPGTNRTFYLYHAGLPVAEDVATATCASGTSWIDGACRPPSSATGTLSASDCTVAAGSSTCNSSITWSTANPVAGASSSVTSTPNITVGTGNSGSATYPVYVGSRGFFLYHNAQFLDAKTATATCVSGALPNSTTGICEVTPSYPILSVGNIDLSNYVIALLQNDSDTAWHTKFIMSIVNGLQKKISQVVHAAGAVANRPLRMTTPITNSGVATAETFTNKYFVDINRDNPAAQPGEYASGMWDREYTVVTNGIGEDQTKNSTANEPAGLPQGTHGVVFCADWNNEVSGTQPRVARCSPKTFSEVGPPPGMSGVLTPASSSCTIPSGGSSCSINFSWAVTNPEFISGTSVTKNPNIVVATGDNRTNVSLAVKYNFETFYLYNSSQLLDTSTVFSSCASGTTWVGGVCQPTSNQINGNCGTVNNACVSGNWADATDDPTVYRWSCNGSNGGSDASCRVCMNGASNPPVCDVFRKVPIFIED